MMTVGDEFDDKVLGIRGVWQLWARQENTQGPRPECNNVAFAGSLSLWPTSRLGLRSI